MLGGIVQYRKNRGALQNKSKAENGRLIFGIIITLVLEFFFLNKYFKNIFSCSLKNKILKIRVWLKLMKNKFLYLKLINKNQLFMNKQTKQDILTYTKLKFKTQLYIK